MGNKRVAYLEYLRVLSMFCVVLIHICITAVTDFPGFSYGKSAGVLYFAVRNLCHFTVPVFFMITGALFLNPDRELPVDKLLKKYIWKYVAVLVLFGWGFALAEEVFTHRSIKAVYLLSSFRNMVEGNSWEHMWYMYELIGVMLIMPVFRAVVKSLSAREVRYIVVVLFVFLSVFPLITDITGVQIGVKLPVRSVYALYVLLGWQLSSQPRRARAVSSSAVILCVAVLCVLDAWLVIMKDIHYSLASYSSPAIVALSCVIFALFRDCVSPKDNPFQNRVLPFLSGVSFPVYLVHMFWINLMYKALGWNPMKQNALICMLGGWAVVSLLSIGSAWVLKKLPLLKTIL